jgi:3-keto-5-aminohexanoate cleavage enzyme
MMGSEEAMNKLIIEVAINETVTRAENQYVPLTPEEIAEDAYQCFLEGATIIHFHNRKPDWDRPTMDTDLNGDAEAYANAMRLMKKRCDLISYPTYVYPGARGREDAERKMHPHVRALREMSDVHLETFVLHVGATNPGRYDRQTNRFILDVVSSTSHESMTDYLKWCNEVGLKQQFQVREPGQVRAVLMYRDMGLIEDPISLHLNFSDAAPYGPLPNARGIDAMLSVIPPEVRYEWFAHHYTTYNNDPSAPDSHRLLNTLAVAMGGHVRIGLGDKPLWDGRQLRNAEMVAHFRAVAEAAGREIATTDETRTILGIQPRPAGWQRYVANEGTTTGSGAEAGGPSALQKVSYLRPTLRGSRGITRLGNTDILNALVQTLAEGGRQRLHAHNAYDGIYLVLSGRVRFYGEGGGLFAEISKNEAVIVPRGVTYGFEAVGGEAEVFYVNSVDRQVTDQFFSREEGSDVFDFDRFSPGGELLSIDR